MYAGALFVFRNILYESGPLSKKRRFSCSVNDLQSTIFPRLRLLSGAVQSALRIDFYVDCHDSGHDPVLFYLRPVRHRQHDTKHHLSHDQFPCGLSDVSKEPVFCVGVCVERYGFDCFMGVGEFAGHPVCVCGSLLCRVSV